MTRTETTPKLIQKSTENQQEAGGNHHDRDHDDNIDHLLETLPRNQSLHWTLIWHGSGFWCPESLFRQIVSFQRNYQSTDNDIILATMPKSGTTWLKALVFSIVNRNDYPNIAQSPLHASNPHELVPFEFQIANQQDPNRRIFATHLPHQALPDSVFSSKCKVVYLCRNPLDQFISDWHFYHQVGKGIIEEIPLEDAFELFLKGVHNFGPFWDQMLGYWYASLKFPEKVLFLKYEDLKKDCCSGVKKIAEFLQIPFTEEEVKRRLIEEITELCSFQSLSDMEINKSRKKIVGNFQLKNSIYFRKGEVGDWVNYLNPNAACLVESLMKEKFGESGLTFEV